MDLPEARPRRVSVVGSTGTGKTTFARELARILDVPHTELDAIVWQPNWTLLPREEFRARVAERLAAPGWVVDGNYGGAEVRPMVWALADTIIWLDFSLPVIYARLWRRTMARLRDREELWPGTGNRETIRNAFFSRGSLFWWALKTYWRRKRNYARLLAAPEHAHVTRLRFRSPAEAERWLAAQRSAAARRI
jgi:adenylate kinase family enzyme